METALVSRALAAMPGHLSTRAKAALLARQVARTLVSAADREPLEWVNARLLALVDEDPVQMLALNPEVDLFADYRRERVARFEARNCRQLSLEAWTSETEAIAGSLEARFSERFRRAARNRA